MVRQAREKIMEIRTESGDRAHGTGVPAAGIGATSLWASGDLPRQQAGKKETSGLGDIHNYDGYMQSFWEFPTPIVKRYTPPPLYTSS